MITCREAQQLVSRAVDGDLAAEQAAFSEHLEHCPQCAQSLAELQAVKSLLHQRLRSTTPPPSLWRRVTTQLKKTDPPVATSNISIKISALIIATAVLAVTTTWSQYRPAPEPIAITEEQVRDAWRLHHTRGPGCNTCQMRLVTDLQTAIDWLSDEIGYQVPPWDFHPEGLSLSTVMVCGCFGAKAPVFRYDGEGRSVWVYVLPASDFIFSCGAAKGCQSPQIADLGGFRAGGLLADRYLLCALSTLPTPKFDAYVRTLPGRISANLSAP